MKYFSQAMAICCLLSYLSVAAFAEVQVHHQPASESQKSSKQLTASTLTSNTPEYKLDAGDNIKIHVFGEPEMDIEVRLGTSGDIRYPFLGKIHISGMTMKTLENKITKALSEGYLVDPQVRVSMEEFRQFYINGEVNKPGGYPYQPGLTVRKAISLSGGFTVEADKDKVFLIHAGDLDRTEYHIMMQQEITPGDIVTIKQSFFYVHGEVKKSGKFSYHSDMTYHMALSIAGGIGDRADEDNVFVIHDGEKKKQHVKNLSSKIKSGDVITVEESFF